VPGTEPSARPGRVRALVLADTHVSASGSRRLPPAVRAALDDADLVLHAGDVVEQWVLDELGAHVPVHAVLGNNDHSLHTVLRPRLELELAGVRVALVHDAGAGASRPARMRRWFPEAQVVVFGHSHAPLAEWTGGQLLFNPGSSTWKRTAPRHTFGRLVFAGGRVASAEIVPC
jgi:putative phosphoesterase